MIKAKIDNFKLKLKNEQLSSFYNNTQIDNINHLNHLNDYNDLSKIPGLLTSTTPISNNNNFIKNSNDFFKNNKFININNYFSTNHDSEKNSLTGININDNKKPTTDSNINNDVIINENSHQKNSIFLNCKKKSLIEELKEKEALKELKAKESTNKNIKKDNPKEVYSFVYGSNIIDIKKDVVYIPPEKTEKKEYKPYNIIERKSIKTGSHEHDFIAKLLSIFNIYYEDIFDDKNFLDEQRNMKFFNHYLKSFIEKNSLGNQIHSNVLNVLNHLNFNDNESSHKIVIILKNMLINNQSVRRDSNPNMFNESDTNVDFDYQYKAIKKNNFSHNTPVKKKERDIIDNSFNISTTNNIFRLDKSQRKKEERTPTTLDKKKKMVEKILSESSLTNNEYQNNTNTSIISDSNFNIFSSKIKIEENSKLVKQTLNDNRKKYY